MSDEGPAYEITPDEGDTWRWTCRRCDQTDRGLASTNVAALCASYHVRAEHPALPPIPTDEGTVIRRKGTGYLYERRGGKWVSVTLRAPQPLTPMREGFDVAEWS